MRRSKAKKKLKARKGKRPQKSFYLPCQIGLGPFERERGVSIDVPGFGKVTTIVDESDVWTERELRPGLTVAGRLKVVVVAVKNDKFIVDLPRETFSSGPRIVVPKDLVKVA